MVLLLEFTLLFRRLVSFKAFSSQGIIYCRSGNVDINTRCSLCNLYRVIISALEGCGLCPI